jgi:uncharacterized protein YjbI with pentapeptide repeats
MKRRVALALGAILGALAGPAGAFDQASLDQVMTKPYICVECDFTNLQLPPGANFGGTNMTRANFTGSILIEATLQRANLTGTVFSGVVLRGANIGYSTLNGANLSRADLTGAALAGSIMRGADLSGANLTGADLSGVNLTGANLKGAVGAVLEYAVSLCDATLPDGSVSKSGCRP